MKINLIMGNFEKKDAMHILTEMIHVKIRFHESKINASSSEEDVKMRENRIKKLQKDLFEVRQYIDQKDSNVNMVAEVEL